MELTGLVSLDPEELGLIVEYSGGETGCTPPRPRRTTINLLCDPDAGYGEPQPPSSGLIESPPNSCSYVFDWYSSYAVRSQHGERLAG